MTIEDLDNKFNSLSANILSSSKQKEVKDTIFNCEKLSTQEFMKALVI